ncbi:hypothetical protein FRC03_002651 [Tulasnella sp. 419]|nr:hypothetical protein FRC03_002651 [Tulasnella sp. 419]
MRNLSPAQLVLRTPELVAIIIESLCDWDPIQERVDSSKLWNCILLNKVISQEALRLFWRDINSLSLLVYLFPAEAYRSDRKNYSLQRNLEFDLSRASVWKRILEITPRVRRLDYIGYYDSRQSSPQMEEWSDSLFMQLYQRLFPDRPLFPRLKYLEGYQANHDLVGLAGLVKSCPSLKSVVIELDPTTRQSAIEARRLSVSLRTLTSLKVLEIWGGGSYIYNDMLDTLLRRNNCLEILLLGDLVQLRHLSQIGALRSLRKLILEGGAGFSQVTKHPSQLASPLLPPGKGGCPQLEELWITSGEENIGALFQALELVQARPSTSIYVDASFNEPSAHRLTLLLASLGTLVGRRLENLRLTVVFRGDHWDDGVLGPQFVLPAGAIEPLYDLRYMRTFRLDVGIPIDFVDNDINQLLSAFPDIEELQLNPKPRYIPLHFATRVSSNSLVQLATGGRKLCKVGLLVNEEWVNLVDTCPSQSVITDVQFGKSRPPFNMSAEDAAGQLINIFPKIARLQHLDERRYDQCYCMWGSAYNKKQNCQWYRISKLLPSFKAQ